MTWDSFWAGFVDVMDSGWGIPVRVLVIILVALIVKAIAKTVIRRSVDRVVAGVKVIEAAEARRRSEGAGSPVRGARRVQRTRSLGRIFDNAATSAIVIVAALLVVYQIWPGATGAVALLAAGLGAGLGIGAQGVVKDVLNGIFFAIEDQLGIGDVIDVGPAVGVVEDVGVRITQVRDVDGALWFIPNGQITRVANMSQGWGRAIVDLTVPYVVDVDAVRDALATAASALAAEPDWKDRILEPPSVWGITSVAADSLVIRVAVKTTTSAKDDVGRELRARIKAVLDERALIPPAVTTVRMDQG